MSKGLLSNNRRLNPIYFTRRGQSNLFNYLPGNDRYFIADSGRGGLEVAIDLLGLTSSDTVLLPAFVAEGVIFPFLKKHIKVRLYDLKADLQVDPEMLDSLIESDSSIRGLVIIHYFGFPQPVEMIKKICEKHNVYLIEDCAQALFSTDRKGRLLGIDGDISFFSLGKMIPVPDGAVFFVNNKGIALNEISYVNDFMGDIQVLLHSLFLISVWLGQTGWSRTVELFVSGGLYRLAYECLRKSKKPARMSAITQRILSNLDYDSIIEKRKFNTKFLYQNYHSMRENESKFICPEFDENYCLMAVPVITEDRQAVLKKLLKKGISCLILRRNWNFIPRQEEEKFPNAVKFIRELFALPVYQDISGEQMEFMVATLHELDRG